MVMNNSLRPRFLCLFWPLVFLLGGISFLAADEVQARAEVEPDPVMAGSTARYQVRFLNAGGIPDLNRPRVPGLVFQSGASRSSSTSLINNQVYRETSLSWNFTATEQGTYTIPGRTVQVEQGTATIPDVTFRVIPPDEEARSRAFLEIDVPDGPYYLGQAIPATVRLLVRGDIDLRQASLPELQGDAFVHTEFSEDPQRTNLRRQNRPYGALVWNITLTPVRSGPVAIRFSQQVALALPGENRRSFGVFGFDNRRTERRSLTSQPRQTEILPLPDPPKQGLNPGAIGDFSLSASLSSPNLTVGEPVTYEVTLTGTGNFSSTEAPDLDLGTAWRTYPPKSSFTPDPQGNPLTGEQVFSYILIPQEPDLSELPAQTWWSFQPDSGSYREHRLPAIPITVAPAAEDDTRAEVFLDAGGRAREAVADTVPETVLPIRPDFRAAPPFAVSIRNYTILNALLAAVFLFAAAIRSRKLRREADPRLRQRRESDKRIRIQLQKAQQASKAGATADFLRITRNLLRDRIAHMEPDPLSPDSLALSDCRRILQASSVHKDLQQRVLHLLQLAEASHFANQLPPADHLPALLDDLRDSLQQLNQLVSR